MSEQVSFEDEVQKLIHADPFIPFSLILSSGDRFDVTDTGFFVFGDSAFILVQRKSGMAILRKSQVIGVEMHPNARA